MTMTYPFPVSADEFKGKRVLVTGGTKGMGQAMVRRFYSERRFRRNDCTLAAAEWAGGCSLRTDGYRYGCRRARCNQSHSAGVGWTRHPSEQRRRVGCSERRIQGAL